MTDSNRPSLCGLTEKTGSMSHAAKSGPASSEVNFASISLAKCVSTAPRRNQRRPSGLVIVGLEQRFVVLVLLCFLLLRLSSSSFLWGGWKTTTSQFASAAVKTIISLLLHCCLCGRAWHRTSCHPLKGEPRRTNATPPQVPQVLQTASGFAVGLYLLLIWLWPSHNFGRLGPKKPAAGTQWT